MKWNKLFRFGLEFVPLFEKWNKLLDFESDFVPNDYDSLGALIDGCVNENKKKKRQVIWNRYKAMQ